MSPEEKLLDMLCTQFRSAHQLKDDDLHLLDLYVRLAAITSNVAELKMRFAKAMSLFAIQLKPAIGL
jgi:hypothetical protein